MSQFNPGEEFLRPEPIHAPPTLFNATVIGTSFFGSRDYDVKSGSYVSTLCLCVLFVPLLALRAYRVVATGEGSYSFLGREPLSAFARAWNAALVLLVLSVTGFAGYQAWYHSDLARAWRKLSQADRLVAQGKVREALPLLKSLVLEDTPMRQEAQTRLENWVVSPMMVKAKQKDYLEIWRAAVELSDAGRWLPPPNTLGWQGLRWASFLADDEPSEALAFVTESTRLLDDPKSHVASMRLTLAKLQERLPRDVNVAVQLAITFEWEGDDEQCERILMPLKDKLGESEGARILGQIALRRGELDLAQELLGQYCEPRLAKFRATEDRWKCEIDRVRGEAMADVNSGNASGFDYARYRRENQARQEQMISQYIESRIRQVARTTALHEELKRQATVVPVVLDWGISQLRRAQGLHGNLRRVELEGAEKTFLSIRHVAGNSPDHQLNLGKVYHWLGKHDEGKKLLDEALAAAGTFRRRYAVAVALREVGAESESRALCERIYESAVGRGEKATVARLRAALSRDIDDQILWQGRASQSDPAETVPTVPP